MNQIGHHTSVTVDGLDYLISVRAVEHDKDGTGLLHQAAAAPDMLTALTALLSLYVELVNCGDCGRWDPEAVPQVIAARAALAKAEGRS